jgi:hypothetical protein
MATKRNLPDQVLYDTRLIQRHIEEGLITEADVEAYRQKCVDVEENKGVVSMDTIFQGRGDSSVS